MVTALFCTFWAYLSLRLLEDVLTRAAGSALAKKEAGPALFCTLWAHLSLRLGEDVLKRAAGSALAKKEAGPAGSLKNNLTISAWICCSALRVLPLTCRSGVAPFGVWVPVQRRGRVGA